MVAVKVGEGRCNVSETALHFAVREFEGVAAVSMCGGFIFHLDAITFGLLKMLLEDGVVSDGKLAVSKIRLFVYLCPV